MASAPRSTATKINVNLAMLDAAGAGRRASRSTGSGRGARVHALTEALSQPSSPRDLIAHGEQGRQLVDKMVELLQQIAGHSTRGRRSIAQLTSAPRVPACRAATSTSRLNRSRRSVSRSIGYVRRRDCSALELEGAAGLRATELDPTTSLCDELGTGTVPSPGRT